MSENSVTVTWMGQMGLWIRIGHTAVSIDYFASDVPERAVPVPVPAEKVTGIDYFIGTHDHSDHIDRPAWRTWAGVCPKAGFVFPSAHRASLEADGLPGDRLIGIDAGEALTLGSITLRALPAAHEFLSPDGEGRYPCLQYIIEGGGVRIWHAGDTLRYEGMVPALQGLGPIDLALLPINGRDGTRYRRGCIGNMTFQEAADAAGEVRPALTLPGHWDMFPDNPGDPRAFIDYAEAKYGPSLRCRIPVIGKPVILRPGE